jgi:adenine-specific DNA-methyltransferase
MQNLIKKNRIIILGDNAYFRQYHSDFGMMQLENSWNDTAAGFSEAKRYVVETNPKIVQRCMLMTTLPGDLVLDITCGSGTTAFVAEQWGRRWITCDTSRVAIALAKKRLMTATYDYYKLVDEDKGVSGGFVYKTVPHVTLKSIANNEPPAKETLYDQPIPDKTKIRISGPFTVEALPAPVGAVNAMPIDAAIAHEEEDSTAKAQGGRNGDSESLRPLRLCGEEKNYSAKMSDWRDELLATGIITRGKEKIEFSRMEPIRGTRYLHAEAETKEKTPRRAVICFAGETMPMDIRMVSSALDEVEKQRPYPPLIVFAAFQFDPQGAALIDETNWKDVTLLKVQMNTDLMTEDLKKKRSSNQSFWLVGQPDAELFEIKKGTDKGKYQVRVSGFDYYNVKTGKVESGNADKIAMWMLDTNYDGMAVEPMQVFFPMGGGWEKLAKTLRAEINQDLIEAYAGTESLPFEMKDKIAVAVKIIDDRGIESLKVLRVGGGT